MAFVATTTNDRLLAPGFVIRVRNSLTDYRAYRRTVAELSMLSNGDLAGFGISRNDIVTVAREAIYGRQSIADRFDLRKDLLSRVFEFLPPPAVVRPGCHNPARTVAERCKQSSFVLR